MDTSRPRPGCHLHPILAHQPLAKLPLNPPLQQREPEDTQRRLAPLPGLPGGPPAPGPVPGEGLRSRRAPARPGRHECAARRCCPRPLLARRLAGKGRGLGGGQQSTAWRKRGLGRPRNWATGQRGPHMGSMAPTAEASGPGHQGVSRVHWVGGTPGALSPVPQTVPGLSPWAVRPHCLQPRPVPS